MKLPSWTKPIERFVNHSIPYVLVLLTLLIIADFTSFGVTYHKWVLAGDYVVILFFVADLFFKWFHVRKLKRFVRLYWIDILAVFPFYVFFRLFDAFRDILFIGEEAQKIAHETRLAREARLLREYESAAKFAKEGKFLRVGVRFLRLLRARWFIIHNHLRRISKRHF